MHYILWFAKIIAISLTIAVVVVGFAKPNHGCYVPRIVGIIGLVQLVSTFIFCRWCCTIAALLSDLLLSVAWFVACGFAAHFTYTQIRFLFAASILLGLIHDIFYVILVLRAISIAREELCLKNSIWFSTAILKPGCVGFRNAHIRDDEVEVSGHKTLAKKEDTTAVEETNSSKMLQHVASRKSERHTRSNQDQIRYPGSQPIIYPPPGISRPRTVNMGFDTSGIISL